MKQQTAQLSRALLPRDMSKGLTSLTPRLSFRALSFRVLAHAEIESYLEDRVLGLAGVCSSSFKVRKHVSVATIALLAFSGQRMALPPNKLSALAGVGTKDDLEHKVSGAVSRFFADIRTRNHGIKEDNVLSMLLPVGVEPSKIDPALLIELNNFGQQRGEAVHSSTKGHITQGINPIDEYKRVQRILVFLNELDSVLTDLEKVAR